MGDVNLEIKLNNIDERVIKIEESGGGSGGDGYITSVSNDFNVVNKKLSLSNDVTTKLSKVDDKIDKPTTATEGQVLTYKNNEWVADDAKGGVDEPTDLEKGIIGGDEYNSTTTYAFDDNTKPNSCIKNNKIYTVKSNVTAFSNIEPTVTSGWEEYWEETSLSALNSKISRKVSYINPLNRIVNNVAQSRYTSNAKLYEATEDCWIRLSLTSNNANVSAQIYLGDSDGYNNNNWIYGVTNAVGHTTIPLKKGQAIYCRGDNTATLQYGYGVYSLL